MEANRIRNLVLLVAIAFAPTFGQDVSPASKDPGTRRGAGGNRYIMPTADPASAAKILGFADAGAVTARQLSWVDDATGESSVFEVADPTGVGATDVAAIQAQIDAANTAGGGIVLLGIGTYDVSAAGVNPQFASHRYCLELFDNVTLAGKGPSATTIRLEDGEQVDGSDPIDLITMGAVDGVSIIDITIDGNTSGQSGWTGADMGDMQPYQQIGTAGSNILVRPTNPARASNLYFANVISKNSFSNSMEVRDTDGCNVFRTESIDCGEGHIFSYSSRVSVDSYYYSNAGTVAVGDAIEWSGGERYSLNNFLIEDAAVGLDAAAPLSRVTNGLVLRGSGGLNVQAIGANPALGNPTNSIVSNVLFVSTGSDYSCTVQCNDESDVDITFTDVHCIDCDLAFSVQGYGAGTARERVTGRITFQGCTVSGDTQIGLNVLCAVDALTIKGCDFSDCAQDGIIWAGDDYSNADGQNRVSITDTRCANNTIAGVNLSGNAFDLRGVIDVEAYGNGTNIINPFDDVRDLSIVNRIPVPTTVAGPSQVAAGMQRLEISSDLTTLTGGTHGQECTLVFTTDDIDVTHDNGDGGIRFVNSVDAIFHANATCTVRYDTSTKRWYELDRVAYAPTTGGAVAPTPTETLTGPFTFTGAGGGELQTMTSQPDFGEPWALAFWVAPTTAATVNEAMFGTTANSTSLYIDKDGNSFNIEFVFGGFSVGVNNGRDGGSTWTDATWDHFVIVWDDAAGQVISYKNGSAVGTPLSLSAPTNWDDVLNGTLLVGAQRPAGDGAFVGSMSDIKFYDNTTVSAAQAELIFQIPRTE